MNTVAIVGTGLLGASLGLALKARLGRCRVIGVSRSRHGLQTALERGAVDQTMSDIAAAAAACDCLVLCTPVGAMGELMRQAAAGLRDDALVTDVGSTKTQVMRDVCAAWPRGAARFIGAHPMAGAERKGAAFARADLFAGAVVLLTPPPTAEADAVGRARSLWSAVGGRVSILTPEEHDAVVARTSHLPHLLATLLTDVVARLDGDRRGMLGTGFLDTTRVAAGDPEMWRDICLTNRDAICALWPEITEGFEQLRDMLETGDAAGLLAYFTRVRDARANLGADDGRAGE